MAHQATPIALTVVSSKYTPLFAILALVQNAGPGYEANTQDVTIFLAITPPFW